MVQLNFRINLPNKEEVDYLMDLGFIEERATFREKVRALERYNASMEEYGKAIEYRDWKILERI